MPFTIATLNWLKGGSDRRSRHIARVIKATDADIVLCQESRPCKQHDQATDEPKGSFLWRAVPGYPWGTGIFSRGLPCAEVAVPGYEGWVVGAEFQLHQPILVFSVHCPAGQHGYVRSVNRILDAIKPLAVGSELVIGGDFNVAAGYRSASDSIRMTVGERNLLDRIASEFGLVPAWQAANRNMPLQQTLRWASNRAAPYHCDGIFIPASWIPSLTGCRVLQGEEWDQLSDHNPVVADLAIECGLRAAVSPLPS